MHGCMCAPYLRQMPSLPQCMIPSHSIKWYDIDPTPPGRELSAVPSDPPRCEAEIPVPTDHTYLWQTVPVHKGKVHSCARLTLVSCRPRRQ